MRIADKRAISVLAGLLLAGAVAAPGLAAEASHVSVGVTTVRSKISNEVPVVVSLRVARADRPKLLHWDYWGTDDGRRPPNTIVTRLTVAIGRDTVLIPFGAYGDLSEPDSVWVSCGGSGATVYLRGGDAAGSYDASFVVLHGMLYKRRVQSGEFPEEVWEETVYSWIPDADDR